MKKNFGKNFLLILVSTMLSLVAAEYIFRWMIFSKHQLFSHLKDPGLYADNPSDDYWKLYFQFDGPIKPPANPQPLLGWGGRFDRDNYEHRYTKNAGNKRPVLIYGDSFVLCVDSVECFEEILNNDSAFKEKNYLLNYGAPGYGVDQIYLLCSLSIKKYTNPFVVVSIMPTDMDRCMLSVRTGQKPYFTNEDGTLVLKGVPINPKPEAFFKENPPAISSYLYSRFLHSSLNGFIHENENDKRQIICDLNEKIILKADSELKSLNVDYVFMIFDNLYNEDGDWRSEFLLKLLSRNNIPFIYTPELIFADQDFPVYDYKHYCILGDGHPRSHYNRIVSEEIKKYVFNYPDYSKQRSLSHEVYRDTLGAAYFEKDIRLNKDWLKTVQEKATKANVTLDSMIRLDAAWMSNERRKKGNSN